MKIAAFGYTLWHVKISFGTHSASASGRLGKESLMVRSAASVSTVPCRASSFTAKAGHSPDTAFSSYLQPFQMSAMALCLIGFVVGPRYDIFVSLFETC